MHNIFWVLFSPKRYFISCRIFFFGVVVTQSARRDIIIRLSLSHVFLKLAPMLCVCSREKQSLYYYFFLGKTNSWRRAGASRETNYDLLGAQQFHDVCIREGEQMVGSHWAPMCVCVILYSYTLAGRNRWMDILAVLIISYSLCVYRTHT
jgi:hypothetical protein